jgi:hypothetical protein
MSGRLDNVSLRGVQCSLYNTPVLGTKFKHLVRLETIGYEPKAQAVVQDCIFWAIHREKTFTAIGFSCFLSDSSHSYTVNFIFFGYSDFRNLFNCNFSLLFVEISLTIIFFSSYCFSWFLLTFQKKNKNQ